MALPPEVTFGTVVGKFVLAVDDGADGDTDPDSQAVSGSVTFTPISALKVASSTPPVTVLPKPITVTLDGTGALSVKLVATDDPATNPHDWVYLVSFSFSGVKYPSFSFPLPAGTTQDLTVLAPVATQNGTPVVRGVGITSVTVDGGGALVFGMSDGSTLSSGAVANFVTDVAAAMAGEYAPLSAAFTVVDDDGLVSLTGLTVTDDDGLVSIGA